MVNFIENFSNYVWIYLMKEKSEVLTKFKRSREIVDGEVDKQV